VEIFFPIIARGLFEEVIFTARFTIEVLRLHVVRPYVRLPLRSVDQDHIGWKSWKLISRTISPTLSLFVAQRPSTYSKGNMGKFWGDEVRWEKWRAGAQKRNYLWNA